VFSLLLLLAGAAVVLEVERRVIRRLCSAWL